VLEVSGVEFDVDEVAPLASGGAWCCLNRSEA
jgi:hypothetical protein